MTGPLLGAAGWVHAARLGEIVGAAVGEAVRYPRRNLSIDITWPVRADGCWCYRHGKGLDVRPHPHDPGLGQCPTEPAGDDYVALAIGENDRVDPVSAPRSGASEAPGVVRETGEAPTDAGAEKGQT